MNTSTIFLDYSFTYQCMAQTQNSLKDRHYFFMKENPKLGRIIYLPVVVLENGLEALKLLTLIEQVASIAFQFIGSFFSSDLSRKKAFESLKQLPASFCDLGLSILAINVLSFYLLYLHLNDSNIQRPIPYPTSFGFFPIEN